MSLRPPTALIFLFFLTVILILEQFFVGLLQIAFNDPNMNFSLFHGIIRFGRLLLNLIMAFSMTIGNGIGAALSFVSFEDLTLSFTTFIDAGIAIMDYLLQIFAALIGAALFTRLTEKTDTTTTFKRG